MRIEGDRGENGKSQGLGNRERLIRSYCSDRSRRRDGAAVYAYGSSADSARCTVRSARGRGCGSSRWRRVACTRSRMLACARRHEESRRERVGCGDGDLQSRSSSCPGDCRHPIDASRCRLVAGGRCAARGNGHLVHREPSRNRRRFSARSDLAINYNQPSPMGWLTRASRSSENRFLPAWIAFLGPGFDRETFQIAGLFPDAAWRTSDLRFGCGSLRSIRRQAVPTQVDHPDFRCVRAEGKRTSALAATPRGHNHMLWPDGLVLSPSRQLRTLVLCRGTCCAEIDRAAKSARGNFAARSASPPGAPMPHPRSSKETARYTACRIQDSGRTSAVETWQRRSPVPARTRTQGRFSLVPPRSCCSPELRPRLCLDSISIPARLTLPAGPRRSSDRACRSPR